MTNAELKDALLQKFPVMCRNIHYSHVSAIIYRECNGQIKVSAELMDINGKSVTIAEAKNIERSEP